MTPSGYYDFAHNPGPPLTAGQLIELLDGLPSDMPIRLCVPEEPGSTFWDAPYIVVEVDVQTTNGQVEIVGDFPAGTYEMREGHPQ